MQGWRRNSIVRGVKVAALRRSAFSVVMSVKAARARSGSVAWRRVSKSRNAGAIFGAREGGCKCRYGVSTDLYLYASEARGWRIAT